MIELPILTLGIILTYWFTKRQIPKRRKEKAIMCDVKTAEAVYQVKEIPEQITCDKCGSSMELVSIELGYSCINASCPLHMEQVV